MLINLYFQINLVLPINIDVNALYLIDNMFLNQKCKIFIYDNYLNLYNKIYSFDLTAI